MKTSGYKKILLGVTGSIAAYKVALLIRLLVKQKYEVKVVMTENAKEFVTPLTLSVLSKNKIIDDFTDKEGNWNNHVELAHWADILLIYPATCQTIAKLASGLCDNILLSIYLSVRCPVMIAPAMDVDMWGHDSTRLNIQKLIKRNCIILDVEEGELASGLRGYGRAIEPEKVIYQLELKNKEHNIKNGSFYANKKILITMGSTREPIDKVRFIGNYSSGKMGKAIVDELIKREAIVTLVYGYVDVDIHKQEYKKVIHAATAEDMLKTCQSLISEVDILIMVAAIADYKSKQTISTKIDKNDKEFCLDLIPTMDVLKTLGQAKNPEQIFIGFALEDGENVEEKVKKKLKEKNLDVIILNNLQDKGVFFGSEESQVSLFFNDKEKKTLPLLSKNILAKKMLDVIAQQYEK